MAAAKWSWIDAAIILPGLIAGVGIGWAVAGRSTPRSVPKFTFIDVCGSMDACWAVMRTSSALGSLAKASDGRYWIFNNESPLRGTYADGFEMEMVRSPGSSVAQNHTMGLAHECFIDRCDVPLQACGISAACRGAWTEIVEGLGSVADLAQLLPVQIARQDARELAACFFSKCLCIADLSLTSGSGTSAGSDVRAKSAHVARFPNAIDEDDAKAIVSLAKSLEQSDPTFSEERHFGSLPRGQSSPLGGHRVTYLQSRLTSEPLLANLYAQLKERVIRADQQQGWKRVHAPTLVPRTIELLNYSSGAQQADASFSLGWHVDEQSSVTALLLLSDPSVDFSGGELYHLAHGLTHAATPRQHELLVYKSHTPHAVGSLTAGTRLAVALEFWHVHAPGEGAEHPRYPIRRVPLLPREGDAPEMTTLGRCPR